MMQQYFPDVSDKIQYEGPESKNPLAFRWYNPEQMVAGKTLAEHLRFSVAYWHTYKGGGNDMFGPIPVYDRPWNVGKDPLEIAERTLEANFEFCRKLGVEFYCFHDRDIAPEGETFAKTCKDLEHMIKLAGAMQQDTGIKVLWGTANLFSNPRYTHGASTNPDAHVFAYAAAQVKHAIDATKELGGENYVFWGGREGYETLLNTKLGQEQEQLARFLHMALDYAKKIGFTGQFLIEPKPCEPTKHQYDHDAATVLSFLHAHDLLDHFKLNIEANHATLAGHTFEHELAVAAAAGKLGSVDANRGDMLLGWDTDQFPTNLYDAIFAMFIILKQGGLAPGGLNFDAKARRGSIDSIDLFHAHIGAMDTFARGLLIAQRIIADGGLAKEVEDRYASWQVGIGEQVLSGSADFESLDDFILDGGEPVLRSGRQEYLENLINSYI